MSPAVVLTEGKYSAFLFILFQKIYRPNGRYIFYSGFNMQALLMYRKAL